MREKLMQVVYSAKCAKINLMLQTAAEIYRQAHGQSDNLMFWTPQMASAHTAFKVDKKFESQREHKTLIGTWVMLSVINVSSHDKTQFKG